MLQDGEPLETPTSTPPAAGRRPRGLGFGVRGLVLGWTLWLLGAWGVLWAVDGWPVPALRVMVFMALVGMMGVWPALRLGQASGGAGEPAEVSVAEWARACRGVAADWLALNLVFQAVVWPLRLAAGWSTVQVGWLVLAVGGWSLLTGLVVAWGRGVDRGGWRVGAMAVCVAVVVAEPLLWWAGYEVRGAEVVGSLPGGPMRLSPVQAVWGLTQPAGAESGAAAARAVTDHASQVVGVSAAAAAGWGVLVGLLVLRKLRETGTGQRAN
ncbi:MAG: hypothetical protein AAF710_07540 [Planctomycetota bacterium]